MAAEAVTVEAALISAEVELISAEAAAISVARGWVAAISVAGILQALAQAASAAAVILPVADVISAAEPRRSRAPPAAIVFVAIARPVLAEI